MKDIRKIMVAIAFYEYAEDLFGYAAGLASSMNADLIVVNVINARDVEAIRKVTQMGYEVDGEHYVQSIMDERKQALSEFIANAGFPEDRVKIVFKVGNPIDELLDVTLDEGIDMIVMGPRGRSDLQHVLIGSVASKLFRRSPVTVVSYRDERHARRVKRRFHGK